MKTLNFDCKFKFAQVSIFTALILLSMPMITYADKDKDKATATPEVYGKSIGNWGFEWWMWVLNLPADDNPLFAKGNMDCSVGQRGNVWFLAGSFGEVADRTCTIKKGKALFIPILNGFMWSPLDFKTPEDCGNKPGMTRAEVIRECRTVVAANIDKATKIECMLDGVPCYWSKQIVRAQSAAKSYFIRTGTIVSDSFEYAPGLRKVAISDGYWIMIDPLRPGQHTLRVVSRYDGNANFNLDVTYHLTVSALDY